MEKIQTIKVLIEQAQIEFNDFSIKNNLKAGTRYRQILKMIKSIVQELSSEALDQKKQIAEKRLHEKQCRSNV
ncbi:hypothetical protein [Pedobacter sp. R20-19]|uniref:hypothetical protein n=1 Tax=Pedobacter sp. R20-19 TaxID=1270196 RepID=UPI0004935A70|nr:hypothetical protein [Pedobacter sp. R20-19]